ncbi:MAG: cytochrome b/b6 domain-containing protein [Gammaproteobacteria bacterium]|nr:cytochrome b/b6 domain-containing protein [Gammaproteobacteria bacterium]
MSLSYKSYNTWSVSVRVFHWINALTILSLIFVGLIMLYKKELGIVSFEAKIGLKELHVMIGYIFATNLIIRLIFGFIGPASARFSAFLPRKGFMQSLKSYHDSIKTGNVQQFMGHNPVGKLAVTLLFTLLIIMLISGLIRAGTDIYYPPFGGAMASYVAADGVDPATIKPYKEDGVDQEKMASLKAVKGPFGKIHLYTAYFLMFLIFIHIAAVIRAEVKEGDRLVSSMISGKKILSEKPQDE